METIIKVNPSELNENLLNKIRNFIGSKNNIDVTISLKEFDAEYADTLDQVKILFLLQWMILWPILLLKNSL